MLIQGDWLPENRAALEDLIRRQGKESRGYNPQQPPFAVFDWDQTIIRHDIGDALFMHQIERLAFALDHDPFWELLRESGDIEQLREGLAVLRGLPQHEWTSRQEHEAIKTALLMSFLLTYDLDPQEGFPWQTRILAGLRPEQVEQMTEEVIDAALVAPLERRSFRVGGHERELRFGFGIRPYAEMVDLLQNLERAGIPCWIVSATNVWAVRTFARRLGFDQERVIGMSTRIVDGIITTELEGPSSATTGKVEAIKKYIHPTQRPILVGGDNITDLPMLEYSSDTRLVIDRGVAALKKEAEARRARGERWLIQPAFAVE